MSTLFSKSAFLMAAALTAALPSEAQHQTPANLPKIFNMQVQNRPLTDPTSPAHRTVRVDCSKIGLLPNGNPTFTKSFLEPFDVEPRMPPQQGNDIQLGSVMLMHLGSRIDGQNGFHQHCTGLAHVYNSQGLRATSGVEHNIGGRVYRLPHPLNDTRFCAPQAALNVCQGKPPGSPVYKFNGQDLTLDPSALLNHPTVYK